MLHQLVDFKKKILSKFCSIHIDVVSNPLVCQRVVVVVVYLFVVVVWPRFIMVEIYVKIKKLFELLFV